MTDSKQGGEMEELRWAYLPEWSAWWLLLPSGERGFGPFNQTEAVWAGKLHGVPFPLPPKD